MNRPGARSRFTLLKRKDTLILYGGYAYRRCAVQKMYSCDYQLGDIWEFDLLLKKWRGIKYSQEYHDLPRERSDHATVLVGRQEYMVMFGGESDEARGMNHQVHKDTWLFDFNDNLWTRFPINEPGDLGRKGHSLVARRYSILTLFGEGFNGFKNDAWEFDVKQEVWSRLDQEGSQFPESRTKPTVVLHGSRVFVFGGMNSGGFALADMFMAEWSCEIGQALRWTLISPGKVPTPRWGSAITFRLSHLFLFGGNGGGNSYMSDLWTYSINNKDWSKIGTWYWAPTGTPYEREDSEILYLPASDPNDMDYLLLFGGHRYNGRGSRYKNYLNDMWTYRLRTREKEEIPPCSDCDDSPYERCTPLGLVSDANSETPPSRLHHDNSQVLIDPRVRSVDEEYTKNWRGSLV